MDWAIQNCVSAAARDKQAGVALYDGAGVLTESNRDPALAAKMLEEYLASSSQTEEAPVFAAHLRLARLEEELGDRAAAQREQAAALALARNKARAGFQTLSGKRHVKTAHNPRRSWAPAVAGLALAAVSALAQAQVSLSL